MRLMSIVALMLVPQLPLVAQRVNRAEQSGAFWFGGGLGTGIGRFGCDICQASRGSGVSGFLRLGGRVGPRLLAGAEASGWRTSDGDVSETLWGLSAVAYVYPGGERFFWKLGAGLLSYRSGDGQDVISANALGAHLGAGYDVPLGNRLHLTPYVGIFLAPIGGNVRFNGGDTGEHANLGLLQLGLGVTRR